MPNIPTHVVFVEAWIRKGDRFLLAQRSLKDDQQPGKWSIPGGKIDLEMGDDIVEDAVRREVREEVGIEIQKIRYFASRAFIRSSGHHVIGLSFYAQYKSGQASALEDQEDVKWVTIEEAKEILEPYWDNVVKKLENFIA